MYRNPKDAFKGDSVEEADRIGTVQVVNLERSRRTVNIFYEMADSKYSYMLISLDLPNCRKFRCCVVNQMEN
jgi:hypothetical protein